MDNDTSDELQKALRPIASLLSKSEKAQRKLAPGTWQHTMLQDNIQALRIATALINRDPKDKHEFTREDLQAALHTLDSMISKTKSAQAKFTVRTSQHALLRNRLDALQTVETLIKAELEKD